MLTPPSTVAPSANASATGTNPSRRRVRIPSDSRTCSPAWPAGSATPRAATTTARTATAARGPRPAASPPRRPRPEQDPDHHRTARSPDVEQGMEADQAPGTRRPGPRWHRRWPPRPPRRSADSTATMPSATPHGAGATDPTTSATRPPRRGSGAARPTSHAVRPSPRPAVFMAAATTSAPVSTRPSRPGPAAQGVLDLRGRHRPRTQEQAERQEGRSDRPECPTGPGRAAAPVVPTPPACTPGHRRSKAASTPSIGPDERSHRIGPGGRTHRRRAPARIPPFEVMDLVRAAREREASPRRAPTRCCHLEVGQPVHAGARRGAGRGPGRARRPAHLHRQPGHSPAPRAHRPLVRGPPRPDGRPGADRGDERGVRRLRPAHPGLLRPRGPGGGDASPATRATATSWRSSAWTPCRSRWTRPPATSRPRGAGTGRAGGRRGPGQPVQPDRHGAHRRRAGRVGGPLRRPRRAAGVGRDLRRHHLRTQGSHRGVPPRHRGGAELLQVLLHDRLAPRVAGAAAGPGPAGRAPVPEPLPGTARRWPSTPRSPPSTTTAGAGRARASATTPTAGCWPPGSIAPGWTASPRPRAPSTCGPT